MKILSLIKNLVYWLTIAVLVVIAGGMAFTVLEAPGGYRLFVVQSGSMEPTLPTGSVVVVAPQQEYRENEIITFFANPNQVDLKDPKATVTHRIVSVADDEGRPTYSTKGDANNAPDREAITQRQVLGKVLANVPYLGYAIGFAKTQTGFIALIVVPGTLIIYSELASVRKEVSKLIREWRQKRQAQTTQEPKTEEVKRPLSAKKRRKK